MSFTWINRGGAATLDVELNGSPVAEWDLAPGISPVVLDALDLTPGPNLVTFRIDSLDVEFKQEDLRLGISDVGLVVDTED